MIEYTQKQETGYDYGTEGLEGQADPGSHSLSCRRPCDLGRITPQGRITPPSRLPV